MVQPLFDQQPDNPIRVEEEIAPAGILVPDDRVQRFELRCLRECKDAGRDRGGARLGCRGYLCAHRASFRCNKSDQKIEDIEGGRNSNRMRKYPFTFQNVYFHTGVVKKGEMIQGLKRSTVRVRRGEKKSYRSCKVERRNEDQPIKQYE